MKSKKLKQLVKDIEPFNIKQTQKPITLTQKSQQQVYEQLKKRNRADELEILKLERIAAQLQKENHILQQKAIFQLEKTKNLIIQREIFEMMSLFSHQLQLEDIEGSILSQQQQNFHQVQYLMEEGSEQIIASKRQPEVNYVERKQKMTKQQVVPLAKKRKRKEQKFEKQQINPDEIRTQSYVSQGSQSVCQICHQRLKNEQQVQRMPCCGYLNHKACLKAYWGILPSCPICQSRHFLRV